MKKVFIPVFLFLVTGNLLAQQKSLGVRVGNPIGISYKQYLGNNHAVEFLIGTASKEWNKKYYRNSFDHYDSYSNYRYRYHTISTTVALQGRYLFHQEIPVEGMQGKVDWFWGVGGFLRFSRVSYSYFDAPTNGEIGFDTRENMDFGPEILFGVEYKFERIPMTVFVDTSLGFELFDRTTFLSFTGLGARYLF